MISSAPSTTPAGGGPKLPVTAFVVTFNEARRLRDCLRSLGFCDQVIVIDLGSADDSMAIARECGAEVHQHERMPIADMVLPRMQHLARNVWRMRFDPDEVFDPRVLPEAVRLMAEDRVGMILLPYQYYFLGRPLRTTFWGGINHHKVFFHRDRTELRPMVHQGQACLPGYSAERATPRSLSACW